MTRSSPTSALLLLAGAALALSACNSAKKPPANSLDAMDNELVEGAPVNEAAGDLKTAIKVDPKRTGKAAATAGTLGEAAARQTTPRAEDGGTGDCVGRTQSQLVYGNGWAGKLPADLPMHPKAQLQEAAGHDGACSLRVVSFTVADEREAVLAWYEDQARKAGYAAGRSTRGGDEILAGTKGDTAFTIMVGAEKAGATPVDYIWTGGE